MGLLLRKLIVINIYFFIFTVPFFSLDTKTVVDKMISSNICTLNEIIFSKQLDDEFVYVYYAKNNNQDHCMYVTNGYKVERYTYEPSKNHTDLFSKYITKLNDVDLLIGDFIFSEKNEILFMDLHASRMNQINIIDYTNQNQQKALLNILFPEYIDSDGGYYKGKNRRVNSEYYINISDIKFGIINGKRGILVNAIGSVVDSGWAYEMDTSHGDKSNWSFFYWSPSEQRYILDESVTQEQIANAYCPEDYFAYNGLKFSKLDSKLTDKDLSGLDKAQLRLMRNAVYARHGRTFKSVDLQSLFDCYTWYKKNPDYSDVSLNETDKYNISLIQSYESKK